MLHLFFYSYNNQLEKQEDIIVLPEKNTENAKGCNHIFFNFL